MATPINAAFLSLSLGTVLTVSFLGGGAAVERDPATFRGRSLLSAHGGELVSKVSPFLNVGDAGREGEVSGGVDVSAGPVQSRLALSGALTGDLVWTPLAAKRQAAARSLREQKTQQAT